MIEETIWVVIGEAYEYDDYKEWNVRGYSREDHARQDCNKLNERLEIMSNLPRDSQRTFFEEHVRPVDAITDFDSARERHAKYRVESLKLAGASVT